MKFDTANNSRDLNVQKFYEFYDHHLLKTRALKREKPKLVGFY